MQESNAFEAVVSYFFTFPLEYFLHAFFGSNHTQKSSSQTPSSCRQAAAVQVGTVQARQNYTTVLPHQRRRRRAKRSVNFFKGDLKMRQKGTFLPLYTYPSHPLLIDLLISLDVPQLKKPIWRQENYPGYTRATTRDGLEGVLQLNSSIFRYGYPNVLFFHSSENIQRAALFLRAWSFSIISRYSFGFWLWETTKCHLTIKIKKIATRSSMSMQFSDRSVWCLIE